MTETRREEKSIARTALAILPLQIIFRVGEGAFPILLAFWFGRSHATDIFFLARAVFTFAGSLVFSVHRDSALVPVLAEERLTRPKEVPRLLGSVLAHTWAVGGVLSLLIAAGALGWFRLHYGDEDFSLAAKMTGPFTLYLVTLSTTTFFGTVLASHKVFRATPVGSAFGMMTTLGILAVGHARWGVALVPLALFVGELVNLALLAYTTLKLTGVRIALTLDRPPALTGVAKLVASDLGGAAITRVNQPVDQLMAGLSGVAGAGTMLGLSNDVASVPTSLLQATLLPVLLAHLSDQFATNDIAAVRRTMRKTLAVVVGLLLAIAFVLYVLRRPLLRLVFLHGEMDEAGVERIASIFPYHLVGLAPFGALLVLARAHIAAKNTRLFLGTGILNAASNAVLNLVFLRLIGLEGLALATSVVSLVVAVVFYVMLQGKLRELEPRQRDAI